VGNEFNISGSFYKIFRQPRNVVLEFTALKKQHMLDLGLLRTGLMGTFEIEEYP
jgi:hypothetical protein